HEDGAIERAVELMQYAIDRRPAGVKPWLALFEIFRLERLEGQFAEFARRFKAIHGEGEYWRKVQFFGREIEPSNALYAAQAFNNLETIGPRGARQAGDSSFDPIAENWLNAPMDFDNEVLAVDLRKSLMAQAAVS